MYWHVCLLELVVLLHGAAHSFVRPADKSACADQFGDSIGRREGSLSDEAALLGVLLADGGRDVFGESDSHAEEIEKADVVFGVIFRNPNAKVLDTSLAAELLVDAKALVLGSTSNASRGLEVQTAGAAVASSPHEVLALVSNDIGHCDVKVREMRTLVNT